MVNYYLVSVLICSFSIPPQQPQKTVWKPTRDIPLNGIAEMAYGHRAYMRLIAFYNNLESTEMAPKGSIIETPPLRQLFQNVGLLGRYKESFDGILQVVEHFPKTCREYHQIGRNTDLTKSEMNLVFSPIAKQMNAYAEMLEKAVGDIKAQTENRNAPKHMLARLSEVAASLRSWAKQEYDPSLRRSKFMDMAEQKLARALANAVAWSRE